MRSNDASSKQQEGEASESSNPQHSPLISRQTVKIYHVFEVVDSSSPNLTSVGMDSDNTRLESGGSVKSENGILEWKHSYFSLWKSLSIHSLLRTTGRFAISGIYMRYMANYDQNMA